MRTSEYPASSLPFDWLMAVLAVLLMGGVIQDGWAHGHGLVDQSFLTPWHAIMYGCMALSGIVLGITGVRNLKRGYSFRRGLPFGYWTAAIGVLLFITGGVFDSIWHTLFGIETDINGLISVSHLWLALGGALVFAGPLLSIAHRYDARSGGWKIAGPAILSVLATITLLGFFTQYAQPIGDTNVEQILAPEPAGASGGQLYSVRADGTRETRLSVMTGSDMWGSSASPDGRRIAFRVQRYSSVQNLVPSDIYVADADGTHAVRISHSGRHDTQVSWSKDGTHLAWVSMPAGTSGNFSIVTAAVDGSGKRTVVDGSTTVQNPSWSPDGKWIAFQSRNGLHQQIAVVPATGGAVKWLSATVDGTEPSWSTSGAIVFTGSDGTLQLTGAAGATAKPLGVRGIEASLSPDGKRVAYTADANGASQIFIAGVNGTHPFDATQLSGMDASHASWRSNSELVFTASGHPNAAYTFIGRAYSEDAFIISSIVVMGMLLLLVRRWRMPLGAMTLILGLYSGAMASQADTYFAIPAGIAAGVFADVLLLALRERARAGGGFYAFAFAVPFVLCVAYETAVRYHDGGLGWPFNMALGSPFIAGFAGLLVAFCYAAPLAAGVSAGQFESKTAEAPVKEVWATPSTVS